MAVPSSVSPSVHWGPPRIMRPSWPSWARQTVIFGAGLLEPSLSTSWVVSRTSCRWRKTKRRSESPKNWRLKWPASPASAMWIHPFSSILIHSHPFSSILPTSPRHFVPLRLLHQTGLCLMEMFQIDLRHLALWPSPSGIVPAHRAIEVWIKMCPWGSMSPTALANS